MQKIVPIYITQNGGNTVDSIIGINTNRIHNDIRIQWTDDKRYTKIEYYIDPAKDITETLLTPEDPAIIYREMDGLLADHTVVLPLMGGGTVSISAADIIYCYRNKFTFERCSVDALVGSRRNLYKLDMTFMELLAAINSP
jgi:hypothetical protein